jgi:hypothetical protein
MRMVRVATWYARTEYKTDCKRGGEKKQKRKHWKWTIIADSNWQERDPTSRQRGRPTKTTQRYSDRINIWSQVPKRARHQDILTDWPLVVTWPQTSGWRSLRWDSKVRFRVLSESDHWVITPQITDLSSHQRGRPIDTRPQISVSNIPTGNNIWSQVPQGCSIPRHTDWLTVSRKVTSTSSNWWWLSMICSTEPGLTRPCMYCIYIKRVTCEMEGQKRQKKWNLTGQLLLTVTDKRQTRPLVREGTQQRQDSKIHTELIFGRKSHSGLDVKTLTDWPTVSRNVTSDLSNWWTCEEAGYNCSTVALRVVRGGEKITQCPGA